MSAKEITKLDVFEGRKIRKTIHNGEWCFSVADVVATLTDSVDTRQYIKRIRHATPSLIPTGVQFVPHLNCWPLTAKDGKPTARIPEGLFRIIQSIS